MLSKTLEGSPFGPQEVFVLILIPTSVVLYAGGLTFFSILATVVFSLMFAISGKQFLDIVVKSFYLLVLLSGLLLIFNPTW